MIKNVLLVDDDSEMLHALKEGFKKYLRFFISFFGDRKDICSHK